MIYTELTNKAMKIAYEAHKDQYDKGGVPYIFHPYHLAEQLEEEFEICVALLHDVVEDTEVTLDDLRVAGFPVEVVEAVKLLTRPDDVDYMDYVTKIKTNPMAKRVKLLDLAHNSDPSRLVKGKAKSESLMERYKKAREILAEE